MRENVQTALEWTHKSLKIFALVFGTLGGMAAISAMWKPGTAIEYLQSMNSNNIKIANNTRDISEKLDNASQEFSDDPVKELVKRGYSMSPSDFRRAITNEDEVAATLFCASAPVDWMGYSNLTFAIEPDSEMFSILKSCEAVNQASMCSLQDSYYFDASHNPAGDRNRMRYAAFCGQSSLKVIEQAELKEQLEKQVKERFIVKQRCEKLQKELVSIIYRQKVQKKSTEIYDEFSKKLDGRSSPSDWACQQVGVNFAETWRDETAKF